MNLRYENDDLRKENSTYKEQLETCDACRFKDAHIRELEARIAELEQLNGDLKGRLAFAESQLRRSACPQCSTPCYKCNNIGLSTSPVEDDEPVSPTQKKRSPSRRASSLNVKKVQVAMNPKKADTLWCQFLEDKAKADLTDEQRGSSSKDTMQEFMDGE